MSKHTPGPWIVKETEDVLLILASGKLDAQIAEIELGSDIVICADETGPHEAKSNAHLIAAAPEMLEVLNDILKTVRSHLTVSEISIVEKVIKKAKGEK